MLVARQGRYTYQGVRSRSESFFIRYATSNDQINRYYSHRVTFDFMALIRIVKRSLCGCRNS